jgi:hypothetical protein
MYNGWFKFDRLDSERRSKFIKAELNHHVKEENR